MNFTFNRKITFLIIISFVFIGQACKKEVFDQSIPDTGVMVQITDDELLELSVTNEGFVFFDGGKTIAGVEPSPHGSFRLKFNEVAASVLSSDGTFPEGAVFPENSLIVKEILSGSDISLYAIMQKQPGDANAASGWVWGEYEPDGKVLFGVDTKGSSCVGCHSENPNRDLTRTFNLH